MYIEMYIEMYKCTETNAYSQNSSQLVCPFNKKNKKH